MHNNIQKITNLAAPLISIIQITIKEFFANNLSLRASALTYTILLSLVPMLAMSTAVVKGLGGGDQLKQLAYTYIETLEESSTRMPGNLAHSAEASSQLTTHLRSAVDQVFDYVDRTNFATLGSFGVAGILLSVILVLSNIETAMNAIWKVHKSRSILRKISDYLTLLILVPISINIAFAASAFLKNPALTSKMDIIIPFVWLQALIFKFIPIFFISLTLMIIYIFFPNTKVKTKYAAIGAAVAGYLWFLVQNVYLSLQIGVANYNAIYGSFATLPLFLVWIFLGWIFILLGAQLAYALQNRKHYQYKKLLASPALQLALCFDIMDLIQTSFQNENNITKEQVAQELTQYDDSVIHKIVTLLINKKAIYQIENNILIPSAPDNRLNSGKLCAIIFGESELDTVGGKKSQEILKEIQQTEA